MKWLRSDGGPMFYGYSNRTPVTGDVQMITTCLVFGTIFTAFLIIFPGVRKERFTTFTTVTLSLFVGNVILSSIKNYNGRSCDSYRHLVVGHSRSCRC
ncbi:dual oxidase maturation factor 1 [Aphis craccivora]|uniref:Dual oxidase maturation factor 1 n=1 Tax=Aphis craccivora TaxID=307492 RepID=A0A6G0Z389_APHCR|nr:dual oxidase maturation factor 1 [Aphis craccivora]